MIFSLRIGSNDHMDLEYIKSLVDVIEECGTCFDEVWLASSYNLLNTKDSIAHISTMSEAAEIFRKKGILASLQISRTLGHSPSHMIGDTVDNSEFNRVIYIDGSESKAVYCWNNNAFKKYIYEMIKINVGFEPEIVWLDDDLRIKSPGRMSGPFNLCFCDNCISLFNEKYGYSYEHSSLKEDFLCNSDIRKEFIKFHLESIADFARIISEAVYAVAPNARMALQNGGNTPLAIDTHTVCLDAMYEVSGKSPAYRAGGGFYDDHAPADMLDKALIINYHNERLPEYVTMRTSEIENLPFVSYGKSIECSCIEAALYMAYGCNMASITLMNQYETLDYHKQIFLKLATYKPFLEKMVQHNENSVNGGMVVYQSENSELAQTGRDCLQTWSEAVLFEAGKLIRCGIPIHTGIKGNVYFLSEKSSNHLKNEDVEFLLQQPVITDALSVQRLIDMGYGNEIGLNVQMDDGRLNGCVEVMSDHSINEGLRLSRWTDTVYYSKAPKYILDGKFMEVISNYCKQGEKVGVAMAIITTSYGAKWIVKGANLSNGIISFDRRNQLLRAINYIAHEPLPAYINSLGQIVVVPRVNAEGKTVSVLLLNVSISECENIEIVIENPVCTEGCTIIDPYQDDDKVIFTQNNGKYTVTIDKLSPWRVKTILI